MCRPCKARLMLGLLTTLCILGSSPAHAAHETSPRSGPLPHPYALAEQEPPYPELLVPGRHATGSVSVGTATSGHLVRGVKLSPTGAHHRIFDNCKARGTAFGTEELINLVTTASERFAREYPNYPVGVCNLSKAGGGGISWSKSHNSGRDVDLGFFILDAKTLKPVAAPGLMYFTRHGLSMEKPPRFAFDVPRNWSLVKALLDEPTRAVQWIFVYRHLKRLMLKHASAIGEDQALIARAKSILKQPSDAHRHNDHFHVRLYCAPDDLAEGCIDDEPIWPWVNQDRMPLIRRTFALSLGLRDPDRKMRSQVLERLEAMNAVDAIGPVAEMALFDPDSALRGRAGSLVVTWRKHEGPAIDALTHFIGRSGDGFIGGSDQNIGPNLAVYAPYTPWPIGDGAQRGADQIYRAYKLLTKLGSLKATPFLEQALKSERLIGDRGDQGVLEAAVAAKLALHIMDLDLVPALLEALESTHHMVRIRADLAIRRITNHVVRGRWGRRVKPETLARNVERWRTWWESHGHMERDEMIQRGFKRRGFRFVILEHEDNIPRLLELTKRKDELGYNADRLLVRITKLVSPRGLSAEKKYTWWKRRLNL